MTDLDELNDGLNRAVQLRDAGCFDQAAAIIRTLREASTHPRDIAYLAVMEASCYREMGDFENAKGLLSKARAVGWKDDSVNLGIEHEAARIERAQGRKAQALKHTKGLLSWSSPPRQDEKASSGVEP
jgi:tetratricopeptide (TPR) repeat protein